MKTSNVVSILIPAYNAEKWIAETLQSALAQTWPEKEIIVVDDGSKDRTVDVAREFQSQGVRVVTQENQGAAAARNKALSLSTGEYIQWLDADDLLSADKVELQMKEAQQLNDPRLLFSCGWGKFMHRPEQATFVPSPLWRDLRPSEWLSASMGQNLYLPPCSWLTSRTITEAAGPWDTQMFVDDDGEYFCRILLASKDVRFVPDAKVYYRSSGAGSLSYIGQSERKIAAQWRSMDLHVGYLLSLENSERTRAACVTYLQNWLGSLYPNRMDLVANAQELARKLGGELSLPRFSWKYAWINTLFGPKAARLAQMRLTRLKWSTVRFWDKVRSQLLQLKA